jgi:hypothetical protein
MNNISDNKQPVDPKLIEMIELMRATPERDPQLVAQSREKYLSELEGVTTDSSKSPLAWLSGLFNPVRKPKRENSKSMNPRKIAYSTLLAIIVGLVMLFGGASATAYASQSALPGDALYPIKTSLEQTQVALARDAYSQAQIYMQFAQRRLDEINELLQEGRYADIDAAAGEFEFHIQQAMLALQTVMTGDPEQGAVLSQEISQALLEYALTLKAVLVNTPEPVKSSVEKALLVSESSAGEELELVGVVMAVTESNIEIADYPYPITISGLTEIKDAVSSGNTVKVHIIIAADGTRIAREIEIAGVEDSEFGDDASSFTDDEGDESDDDNQNANENNSNEDSSDDNLNSNESNSNDDAFGDDLNENSDESNENSDDHDGDLNNNNDDDHAGDEQDDNRNDNDNSSGDDSGDESDDDHSSDNDNSSDDDDHSNNNDNSNDDDESSNPNSNDNNGENGDEEDGNSNDNFSDDD